MSLPRIILACVWLLTAMFFNPPCFAWGTGHNDVVTAIFERLPDELRYQFAPVIVRQAVSQESHYPDSMESFDVEHVGDEAIRRLKEHGIKNRHGLHSDAGRAVAFGLLVDALRTKHFKRVALWIAALSHSTADMAACNHDPLVHTATYGWTAWKLKLPGGAPFKLMAPLLDLHAVVSDNPAGKAAFAKLIKAMSLHDDQRDAAIALLEIMLYGHEGARFCGPRGTAIMAGAAGWVDRQDITSRELLQKNMAELGAWAVVRTVRDVEVASRLARASGSVEPTPALKAAYQERLMALVRESRLAEDLLFAPLLRDKPVGAAPVVGVVMEPRWRMNDAMLGFSSRVTAASIARTFQQTGRAYVTLDVRDMITTGLPSPGKVPVVIVVAASFGNYQQMKTVDFDDRIAGYLARGGRVVWIGGTAKPPSKSLGVIARAMKKGDAQMLPISEDVFVQSRLRVAFGNGDKSWKVAHSPKTPAGWQQPVCPWQFDSEPGDNLEPALKLDGPGSLRVVGVITKDHKLAFLPIYAVTPWLLEGSDSVVAASEPALDAAGRTILFSMLEYLK